MLPMLAMTVSMILVGWVIWRIVNRVESGDRNLQQKLDDDDRRAAIGRGERVEPREGPPSE